MIGIINYGSGNVQATSNIYRNLKITNVILNKPDDIDSKISKLILPGVGAFDTAMKNLNKSGFRDPLDFMVLKREIPVLGICVGFQILSYSSTEGSLNGLGWIAGHVKKLDVNLTKHKSKIPHLGWNSIYPQKKSVLLNDINMKLGFYFLHSYYFEPVDSAVILTTTNYGTSFVSSVNKNHIYGTQFHPEKSHSNGITLLKNFANI